MQLKTQGLIIKERPIGENDRLVTILTKDEGVIRAFARKAMNLKDNKNSATQLLCYSRLSIYKGREKYIINDARPIEVFFGLRSDISKLALAQYFCELAALLAPEGVDSSEFLRVVLNAMHFLCSGKHSCALLKAIVEMRMLSFSGYMPNLVCCTNCVAYETGTMCFLINKGELYCADCFSGLGLNEPHVQLSPGALKAMRHIVFSDFDKLFSFNLAESAQKELGHACEAYILSILQCKPGTLDFYHAIL